MSDEKRQREEPATPSLRSSSPQQPGEPKLVAQLHDCDVYEGTPEEAATLIDRLAREALKASVRVSLHGLTRLRAAREANGKPPPSEEELKDLREWQRRAPGCEPVIAALETFAGELQAKIEWIAKLHRNDKTGQAGFDQRRLDWLRRLALQLAQAVENSRARHKQ